MELAKILSEATPEDLKEPYNQIADIIGIDNLSELSAVFGGAGLYIPTNKQLFKKLLFKKALSEYNGFNIKALAAKYGISESTMYRIIRNGMKK